MNHMDVEVWPLIPMAIGMFALYLILFSFVINVVVCFLLYRLFQAVPPRCQRLTPELVWLLLIPVFNLAWNFVVFLKLSDSYQVCFEQLGDRSAGECNRGLGLAYAILCVCTMIPCIPCVGTVAGLAALVVLILYLINMYQLRDRLASG